MARKQKKTTTENPKSRVANLSLKSLGCEVRLKDGATTRPLCRIIGKAKSLNIATDTKRGDAYSVLQGIFEGVNLQDPAGRTIASTRLYLPGGIHEAIENDVRAMAADSFVLFGYDLTMKKTDTAIGYQIEARNVFPRVTRHELAEAREALAAGRKPTPAPAKE